MDYFVHPTSIVDEDVLIGEGTKIWHFSHIQSGARIGKDCSLGQNVNVSNNVIVGNGCKIILYLHVACHKSETCIKGGNCL